MSHEAYDVILTRLLRAENGEGIVECPYDGCQGFFFAADKEALRNDVNMFQCPTCQADICKDCDKQYQRNHRCNQEPLENLGEDNRRCPNPDCLAPVHRIIGCNNMRCGADYHNYDRNLLLPRGSCGIRFCWECGLRTEGQDLNDPHGVLLIPYTQDVFPGRHTMNAFECRRGDADWFNHCPAFHNHAPENEEDFVYRYNLADVEEVLDKLFYGITVRRDEMSPGLRAELRRRGLNF